MDSPSPDESTRDTARTDTAAHSGNGARTDSAEHSGNDARTDSAAQENGHGEPHSGGLGGRLNWLRAGVLGANDGVVSTSSIVLGVAGATSSTTAIITAGLAGMFAGALSMASGEYVSVSSQRDSERAMLDMERRELAETADAELDELTGIYESKGLSHSLARQVAEQLTAHDALAAHAEAELGIDPEELVSPWQAAFASFVAFTAGALLPVLVIGFVPSAARIAVTVVAVLLALVATGAASARLGKAPPGRAVLRNVVGGAIAMGVTYGVGRIAGVAGI